MNDRITETPRKESELQPPESADESITMTMKLITEQRAQDEKLELRTNEDYQIIDRDGVVYDGIVLGDGTVDTGFARYDSAATFERVTRELVEVAAMWAGRHHYTLLQDKQTGELFSHRHHRQVSPSDWVEAVDIVQHLASWLLDLDEQQTVTFVQTGHLAVSLPVDLVNQIHHLAYLEKRTTRDWIAERLTECVRDDRSTATLAAEEDRQKRVAVSLERLRCQSNVARPREDALG